MRKKKIQNIATERELQVMLLDIEKRWARAYAIKDSRKRFKEVLRVRSEIKLLMESCKKLRRTTNSSDNNEGFFSKAFKIITSWLSGVEKKYKNV